MSKTHTRIVRNDVEREEEPPTHRLRRRLKQRLDELVNQQEFDEDDVEEIETFERIRKKSSR